MPKPRFAPGSTAVFTVKNRSGKKNLATYLASRLGVVDAWAEGLIADGRVLLDGSTAGPGDSINLSAGPHEIEVRFPDAWPRHMAATPMDLAVIHEDDDLIALDKPPGIVVHPARGHLNNQTLQNGVRHRYRHRLAEPGVSIGPPHRLDKDTSGVVLFALTTRAFTNLAAQFAAGLPGKEYLAILDGDPDFEDTVLDAPIGADPENKGRSAIIPVDRGGKAASTAFTILERGKGWALALAAPKTGRAHQIRVHAASLGLPMAGDRDYNPHCDRLGCDRQALHAAALTFRHPITGGETRVEAPLPADMAEALARLRETRKR